MFMFHTATSCRVIGLSTLGAMMAVSALAAGVSASAGAQAQYLQDRAACPGGQSKEDFKTCLKEDGAAPQTSHNGGLASAGRGVYRSNARLRCYEQPASERADRIARMQKPPQGSVAAGGLLFEPVTPVGPQH